MSTSTVGRNVRASLMGAFLAFTNAQESAELVDKILREGMLGVATSNSRIRLVVFICLDNGKGIH